MKKNNFKKISVLIGLIGSLSIFKVNAMNNNENFFNLRKDVKLLHEDDKIIKWINGSNVTPLEFIRNFLNDNGLIYDKTKRCFIVKRSLKCEKYVKVCTLDVLRDIIDKFLETNIKDYKKTISECENLRSEIENLDKGKKGYYGTNIFYTYDDELNEDYINNENVDELNNKKSRLYNPELYNKLINERKEKEEKNLETEKHNMEIEKKIEKLKQILNDEHHKCCEFLKNLRYSILNNTEINNIGFYNDKGFLKDEILLKNNHTDTENMEILEKIIEVAEEQNKNHKFWDLKQRSIKSYKMFLIFRKFIEIFSNNPSETSLKGIL